MSCVGLLLFFLQLLMQLKKQKVSCVWLLVFLQVLTQLTTTESELCLGVVVFPSGVDAI